MKIFVLCLLSLVAAGGSFAEPLRFSAVGCGPYRPVDEVALRHFLAQENLAVPQSAFFVHLGDINSGALASSGNLGEERYAMIGKLLTEGSRIPAYIVPGDNEWNDRPDPEVGWRFWRKHLLRLEEKSGAPWVTERQEVREENFAFVGGGVLFIGLNLVGGRVHDPVEWASRFKQDNDWVEAQYLKHRDEVRAAVVFAQANVVGQGKPALAVKALFLPFTSRFAKLSAGFGKPVLFLHADGHVWTRDRPWEAAPNVLRVQVDLIRPEFPPVQVTVRDEPGEDGEMFGFSRRQGEAAWEVGVEKEKG